MNEDIDLAGEAAEVIDAARAAEHAIQHETDDSDLAIDAARLHLDGAGQAALSLHRQLDAAHNGRAHIAAVGREAGSREAAAWDVTPRVHRSEDRWPSTGAGGTGRGLPR